MDPPHMISWASLDVVVMSASPEDCEIPQAGTGSCPCAQPHGSALDIMDVGSMGIGGLVPGAREAAARSLHLNKVNYGPALLVQVTNLKVSFSYHPAQEASCKVPAGRQN